MAFRGAGCTGPGTWRGGERMGFWSFWVEAALLGQAGVGQAVVVARGDGGAAGAVRTRLVGYVVGSAGAVVDPAGLRAALGRRLPDYMVPSGLVVLERLPLTPNGKLDRRALPAPERDGVDRERRGPRTEQEAGLCRRFAELMGVAGAGSEANFFERGGDSIVAIQLVSRARQAGLRLSARAVFQHQTVAGLAAAAESAAAATPSAAAPADIAVGELVATPILRWLEDRGGPVGRFSQSMLLQAPAGLQIEHL